MIVAIVASYFVIKSRDNSSIPFDTLVRHFGQQKLSEEERKLMVQSIAIGEADSALIKTHFSSHRSQLRQIFPMIIDQILLKELVDSTKDVSISLAEMDRIAAIYEKLYKDPTFHLQTRLLKTLTSEQKKRKLEADYLTFQGDTLRQNRQLNKALEKYNRALQGYIQIGETGGQINAHYMIGYSKMGEKYNESLESFERCLELARKIRNPIMEMRLLFWIGFIQAELRNYPESEQALHHAITLSMGLNEQKIAAQSKSKLGAVYGEAGHLLRSEVLLKESLDIFNELGKSANIDKASTLRRLGFTYESLGDFTRAFNAHNTSLNIYQELALPEQEAAQYTNLGIVYSLTGEHELALKHHHAALNLFEKYGRKEDIADAKANVGEAYYYMGKLDSALHNLQAALNLAEGQDYVAKRAEIYQMIGDVKIKQKDWQRGSEMFLRALQINQNSNFRIGLILNHLGLGQVALQTKQNIEALEHFEKSLHLAIESGNSAYAWKGYYGKGLALKANGAVKEAVDNFKAAIDTIESGRNRIQTEHLRLEYFAEKQEVFDEVILTYLENLQDSSHAFDFVERAKARSFLDFLYGGANIVEQSKTIGTGGQALALVAPASSRIPGSREIQASLGPQDKIIEYRVFDDRTVIWSVDREKLSVVSLPVRREELQKKVLQFRETIGADQTDMFKNRVRKDRQGAFKATMEIAQELSSILIKPVWAEFGQDKNVYIVPDDILHYLPFGALMQPDPNSNQFLIEAAPLTTMPSAAVLKYALEKRKIAANGKNLRILAIADPRDDLPWAQEAARSIVALFTGSKLLTGQQARKDTVCQAMESGYDVIDFGTHCTVDEKSPLYSALYLAPPAPALRSPLLTQLRSASKPEFEDPSDLLRMYEVFNLDLAKTRLVVLSACETALGRFVRGEGLVGLARAFMYAGSPTVITTLWKVDDKATARLMVKFYNNLKTGQYTVSQALRNAQIDEIINLRRDPFVQFPYPYFWAPFMVAGNSTLN